MTGVTVTARCHGCGWTAGPAPWPDADTAAEKHTTTGHPTVTIAEPATTRRKQ